VVRGRSLFDVEIGDRVLGDEGRSGLWVMWGDRCLMWGKGDRVLWVVRVRSLFDDEGIGDRVLWVLRGRSLFDVGNRRSGLWW